MQNLILGLLVYLALGAVICASPRDLDLDLSDLGPAGQWRLFRHSLGEVMVWPRRLWRAFNNGM